MSPARWPREDPLDERLLVVDPSSHAMRDARVRDLPRWLRAADLLVVNDAGTLPASLSAGAIEVRLAGEQPDGAWLAVSFGEGDFRTPTEQRPPPPALPVGHVIAFDGGRLSAQVVSVSPVSPRLVTLRFAETGAAFWSALYASGRPIQYAYVDRPLALWHVQTAYAARPWAVELPSAGRPLRPALLAALAERGVAIARVTHAAGLSSTGDPAIDRRLPFPERYEVPEATVRAVERARAAGGRVVAVGTSVVRALEGAARANGGVLAPGAGVTDLVVDHAYRLSVVDGLFTGMHEPGASHFALLEAFTDRALAARAHAHAEAHGYLAHEFGDASLVLRDAA